MFIRGMCSLREQGGFSVLTEVVFTRRLARRSQLFIYNGPNINVMLKWSIPIAEGSWFHLRKWKAMGSGINRSCPSVLDALCGEQRGPQPAPRNQKGILSVWRRYSFFFVMRVIWKCKIWNQRRTVTITSRIPEPGRYLGWSRLCHTV